jgi:mannosylglycerate hydrolase
MGVTSNRVDVKRLGESAVRQLERRAEPLAALFQGPSEWPKRQLDLAWKEIVRNSAHDSICACSVDEVVDAVLHRYAEAGTMARGLAERATRSLAGSLAQPGSYVINPAHRARSGMVELVVGAAEPPTANVQVLSEWGANPVGMALDADTVRSIFGMMQSPQIDHDTWLHDIVIEEDDEGIDVTFWVGADQRHDAPIARAKRDIYARLEARPDAVIRLGLHQPVERRIAARVAEVPGYGWRLFEPETLNHTVVAAES